MTGPSHFLACGSTTGATLLKHRHLRQLGYALVVVPYWEWEQVCRDETSKVEYLQGKLASSCVGEPAAAFNCHAAEDEAAEADEPHAAPAAWEDQGKPEDLQIQKGETKSASKKRERDSSFEGLGTEPRERVAGSRVN